MADPSPYNIISICAGFGGLDLAVGLAVRNAVTVCYVERDVEAAAGLGARMDDESLHAAPVWSDLSTFDGTPWRGTVDCIISGDPCQPNSVAGSGLGSDDDRFLIDQLIRVIGEVRPARVFRENVPGNADGQLAVLIPALERLGYRVAAGIFSAEEVGASHRRERLFVMADRQGERSHGTRASWSGRSGFADGRGQLAHANGGIACEEREQHGGQQRFQSAGDEPFGDVSDAFGCGCRPKSDDGQPSEQFDQISGRVPYFAPGPSDLAWRHIAEVAPFLAPSLAGLDVAAASIAQAVARVDHPNWQETAQSIFRGMADGLASRVDRLRAGGNGVCAMAGAVAWLSLSAHFEDG